MSQKTVIPHPTDERARETARARAELERLAEAEGVRPFTTLEDFSGGPELTADFDVEQFLQTVREDRDRPSARIIR
ncbi:MAG TPA: hypothetical protein VM934_07815 [Pyrinomonadaceae bacterium]|jgi:hypothetical protein|nr:hypothetical protein [Pyrinomonadaceae bacterium]